jgi:PIN domain nuclease of toxin-antitoxin system
MRVLIDTHVFLWAVASHSKLSAEARDVIADRENDIYVSAAATWEIVTKVQTGKLKLPMDPTTYIRSRMSALGFSALAITHEHTLALSSLPLTHKDPFDRIMIAQAQIEGLTFITRDARLLIYAVNTIKA